MNEKNLVLLGGLLLLLSARLGLDGSGLHGSGGSGDLVHILVVEQNHVLSSQTGVGVGDEVLGLRAVNVVPPIADQRDLVEQGLVGAEVAGDLSVVVASMEGLAFGAARVVGVESHGGGLAVDAGCGDLAVQRVVLAGHGSQVQLLDFGDGQRRLAAKGVQGVPDFGVLVAVAGADDSDDGGENEVLHDSFG